MIHGEFELEVDEARTYTTAQLAAIEAQGVEVEADGDEVEFVVPLNVAFGNPDLLRQLGVGAVLHGIGGETEYKNDEQIDNQLRSVLFQVPVTGHTQVAWTGRASPALLQRRGRPRRGGHRTWPRPRDAAVQRAAQDLRAETAEVVHGDHRRVDGPLPDQRPADHAGNPINDPNILDFTALFDIDGNPIPLGSEAAANDAVVGVRRTTLAARLKAIYGDPDKLDAFVGMLSERHVKGTEFGELQLAMWKQQFQALRDGDRFFYLNDRVLPELNRLFGIDYRRTLAQIIEQNTGIDVQDHVFEAVE